MKHALCFKKFRIFILALSRTGAASLIFALVAVFAVHAQTISWASAGLADGQSVNGAAVNASSGPVVMNVVVNSTIVGGGVVNLDAFSGGGQGPASYENSAPFGGITNFVEFGFDNSSCDTNDQFEVVMSFTAPINDVQMTIVDIDQNTWDDIIEIDLDVDGDGLGPQNIKTFLTNSSTGAPLLTLAADVEEDNEAFADGYEGTVSVPSGNTNGNMILNTTASGLSINSITIRYYSGNDGATCTSGGNPGGQRVGLSNVQFNGTTVPVTLSYFASSASAEELELNWETAQEVGHAGFQLYARSKSGWVLLTPELITSSQKGSSLLNRKYHLLLPLNEQEEPVKWLSLVDVSMSEEVVPHGPFQVGKQYGGQIIPAAEFDWAVEKKSTRLSKSQSNKVNARIQRLLKQEERAHRAEGE